MSRPKRIAQLLDEPTVKAVAASATVAAGGALAAKLVHDRQDADRARRRYRLAPGETARAGTVRVARAQLDRAVDRLHANDVHTARKALKRTRAVIRLNRPLLGRERFGELNRTFRDAGRAVSGARDAEALLEALDGLLERGDDGLAADPRGRFRGALLEEAGREREDSGNGDAPQAVAGRLERAREEVAHWPLPDSGGPDLLADGFKRVYRQGRRAARTARREPSLENLHELRKRSKDLWYGAQLLRCSSPKRANRLAKRAHRLADLLGDEHDLALLRQRAEREPELFGPGELELLLQLIERRRRALRVAALSCAKRIYRRKPSQLVRRLGLLRAGG